MRYVCSAHFCHLNHFCHCSPVLSIHINRFCQPHHFCKLLSTQSSPVLSTISTTYVATDEVTTFVNKARPLLSTVIVLPTIIIITGCSMRETRETALLHAWVQSPIRPPHPPSAASVHSMHIHTFNKPEEPRNQPEEPRN